MHSLAGKLLPQLIEFQKMECKKWKALRVLSFDGDNITRRFQKPSFVCFSL